jgi:hypothetical protein
VADPVIARIVLPDTNVLINFIHIDRLGLLGNLPDHQFLVPEHVIEEVSDPGQRERLEAAFRSGFLTIFAIIDLEEIESFARFHRILGQGGIGMPGCNLLGGALDAVRDKAGDSGGGPRDVQRYGH